MAPPQACLKGCGMRKDRNLALQGELFLVSAPIKVQGRVFRALNPAQRSKVSFS